MRTRLVGFLASACLLAGSSGCSQELGAESFPTGVVKGKIHVGPRPIAGGFMEFHPYLGTVGTLRVTRIGPDGSFEIDRVPAGQVIIGFEDLPGNSVETVVGRMPGHLFRMQRARIIRTIKANESNSLDIDLGEEALRMLNP